MSHSNSEYENYDIGDTFSQKYRYRHYMLRTVVTRHHQNLLRNSFQDLLSFKPRISKLQALHIEVVETKRLPVWVSTKT